MLLLEIVPDKLYLRPNVIRKLSKTEKGDFWIHYDDMWENKRTIFKQKVDEGKFNEIKHTLLGLE